jgi:hypothetical protein
VLGVRRVTGLRGRMAKAMLHGLDHSSAPQIVDAAV